MPAAEALLAGTLALLTGLAQAGVRGMPAPAHAEAMRAKIVANLHALADHPGLSAPMRQMLLGLHARWQAEGGVPADARLPERALWLPSPAALQ